MAKAIEILSSTFLILNDWNSAAKKARELGREDWASDRAHGLMSSFRASEHDVGRQPSRGRDVQVRGESYKISA